MVKDVNYALSHEQLPFLGGTTDETFFRQILDALPYGVVAIDETSRIFYTNPAYTKILGIQSKQVVGKKMQEIEPDALILKVLETRAPINRSALIKSISRYVRANIYPLYEGEVFKGAVSFFRDVTREIFLQEELRIAHGLAEYFKQQLDDGGHTTGIVGNAPNFINAQVTARLAAPTDAAILIMGEHGVGKEIMAKAIHTASPRDQKPFIAINCAALPEDLLESELFGYEEGAFTGAKKGGRLGKFELANGGTIFLDEVGDMSLRMQAKLLRALQEKEIDKIGGSKPIKVDARIIAATNRNLKKLMSKGKFREDLYYRLNVVAVFIPPLRDREGDVAVLSEHFLHNCQEKYGKKIRLSEASLRILLNHNWPGNVRELQNCIEYAAIMCPGGDIHPEYLPNHITENTDIKPALKQPAQGFEDLLTGNWQEIKEKVESALLQQALKTSNGNRSAAIRSLGLSRRAFYQKLKQYNIES